MSTTPAERDEAAASTCASTCTPASDARGGARAQAPAEAPSEARAIATRIVDVAQGLVRTRGYNAFSYRDLSERVGIKTSSIHYHFPAKSDLALALVQRYIHSHAEAIGRLSREESPACKLRLYLEMLCREFEQSGLICLCGMLATDAHSLPQNVQLEIRAFFRLNEEWLAQTLRQGLDSGDFRFQSEPDAAATSVFATIQGAMISAYTFGDAARFRQATLWIQDSLRAA